jgi:methylmalonyl-CoA/ethylmalonyl-CoA epimerase
MISLADSRIAQIAIVCKDVERAKAFYRDALGLPHLFDAPPGLSFFQCGSVRLMLARAEGDASGSSTLYFLVSDIEHSAQRLELRGVTFAAPAHLIAKMPDHDLWLAEFRDSEGNVMALMEEKRPIPEPQPLSIG